MVRDNLISEAVSGVEKRIQGLINSINYLNLLDAMVLPDLIDYCYPKDLTPRLNTAPC